MKTIVYLFAAMFALFMTTFSVSAQEIMPYEQGFDTYPPTGWTESKGFLSSNSTITGIYSNWTTDGFANVTTRGSARMNITTTNKKEWMFSPSINLNGTTTATLEFDIALTKYNGGDSSLLRLDDSVAVVISTDNGATWSNADTLMVWAGSRGDTISNVGQFVSIDLSAYTGIVKFGFYATSTVTGGSMNVYIDNFAVKHNLSTDLGLMAIVEPEFGFNMNSTMSIKVNVKNNSLTAKSGYTISYSLDNGTTFISQTIATALAVDADTTITFTTTADFSNITSVNAIAAVNIAGDTYTSNDTITTVINNGTLAYSEGFETFSITDIPDGWKFINTTGNSYAKVQLKTSSTSSHSGNMYLRLYNSGSTTGDLIASLPAVYSGVSPLVLKAWVKSSVAGIELVVGIMTDNNDPSTFTAVDTITCGTVYAQAIIDFSSYTGTGKFIAFRHPQAATSKTYYVDDIELYEPVQNELMMLSWDASKSSIEYTSGSIIVSVYNNGITAQSNVPVSYSIDGGTTFVNETIAGPINPADTLQYTFTTAATFNSGINNCIAVVSNGDIVPSNDTIYYDMNNYSIPYMDGFETSVSTKMPDGWTSINTTGNASAYTYAYHYAYYSHSGEYNLKIYNNNSTSGDLIAALPEYGGTTLTDKWIKFWHRGYSTVDLIVGVMTDINDASTFEGIDTITPADNYYNLYVVSFGSYTGTGKYIAFKHGMNGTYKSLYVDDISLEIAPTGPVFDMIPDSAYTFNNIRYNYNDTLNKSFTVTNLGIGQLSVSTPTISGTNAANYIFADTNTYPKSLGLNESLTFEVRFFGSTIGSLTADLVVNTDTVVLNGDVVDPIISSFPYFENFDDRTLDLGWSLQGGAYKWLYDNDQTISSSTGPMNDVTGGSYIYTEASSGIQGAIASILTNPIDISSLSNAKLNYWYHMYGSDIDSLSVQLAQNGAWTTIDTINGQQHTAMSDPWLMQSIDLSSFSGSLIDSIRFKAIRGPSYKGDIAIDNIAFGEDFIIDLGADAATCDSTYIKLNAGMGATPWTYEWTDVATGTVVGTDQTFDATTSGTYAVIVYDEGYFTGSDTINVIIDSYPTAVMSPDATICEGDPATISAGSVSAPSLIFAMYIEGSSNNKGLSVFNATVDTLDLANYRIAQASNGNGWSYYHTFPTGAKLAPNTSWVMVTNQVDPTMYDTALANEVLGYPSLVHFNGDDARAIEITTDGGTTWSIIDIIGDPNNDPGSGWSVAGVNNATKDHSIIRKSTIISGDTSWTNIAGTDSINSQYTVYSKNTFTGLGNHMVVPPSNYTYLWSTGETTASIVVNPTTTSIYTVVIDNGNCQVTDSVTITVNAYPVVDLGADQTIKWTAGTVTLDAGNAGMVYIWSTGETTQTATYDQTNLAIGDTTISVIVDNNGCTATDTIVITLIDDVSINGALNDVNVSIYPNPNSGQFTLSINGAEGNMNMEIVNLAGQVVYTQRIEATSNFTTDINVSEFATGVYYIKLSNNDGVKVNKLIIK